MWVIKQEFGVRYDEEESNESDGGTDLIELQCMLQTINNTVPVCCFTSEQVRRAWFYLKPVACSSHRRWFDCKVSETRENPPPAIINSSSDFHLPKVFGVWGGSKTEPAVSQLPIHQKKKGTKYKNEHPSLPARPSTTPSHCSEAGTSKQGALRLLISLSSTLNHVHGVLGKKRVDVGERWAELAVSVPAAQHELVETLRTHRWPAQVHLRDKQRHEELAHGRWWTL